MRPTRRREGPDVEYFRGATPLARLQEGINRLPRMDIPEKAIRPGWITSRVAGDNQSAPRDSVPASDKIVCHRFASLWPDYKDRSDVDKVAKVNRVHHLQEHGGTRTHLVQSAYVQISHRRI